MRVYKEERLNNAICFFAREHTKRTAAYPHQSYIYKYLAFFEFEMLKETGDSPLELVFSAMENGPVPFDLYSNRHSMKTEYFVFENKKDNHFIVKALRKPDMDYFSEHEIEKMNNLINLYAKDYIGTQTLSKIAHEKIVAWKKAYDKKINGRIDKSDTFENIYNKKEDELTWQEEHFLINQALHTSDK